MEDLDAVLIPGGGLTGSGEIPAYVAARLDRALQHSAAYYIPLSGGTPHRPTPRDANGYPIYEAVPSAAYLHARGIPQRQILTEVFSYDTIGNAFFARLVHTDPRQLRRLHIINSEFHMARTQAIFEWVFNLSPHLSYALSFEAVENVGLSPEALEIRAAKEHESLEQIRFLSKRIDNLADLHEWMFTEHGAYAWFRHDEAYRPLAGSLGDTYGNPK